MSNPAMNTPRLLTPPECRGEHLILVEHPNGSHEVLYRTRHPERVPAVLKAAATAWDRGRREGFLGWGPAPHGTPIPRGLFDLGRISVSSAAPQHPDEFAVIERHRRVASWDCPLYTTPSIADAHMVLGTLRRVATMGALSSMGLNTLTAPRWLR